MVLCASYELRRYEELDLYYQLVSLSIFLLLISQKALLILSATHGATRIFQPPYAAVCSER